MQRWFPKFKIVTACFSCRPPTPTPPTQNHHY